MESDGNCDGETFSQAPCKLLAHFCAPVCVWFCTAPKTGFHAANCVLLCVFIFLVLRHQLGALRTRMAEFSTRNSGSLMVCLSPSPFPDFSWKVASKSVIHFVISKDYFYWKVINSLDLWCSFNNTFGSF